MLKFFVGDPDPGSDTFFGPGSGMEKFGSATLNINLLERTSACSTKLN